ncbi:MAG TPA: YegP family protein [Bacteroidia bacterium]|nr:YegP family protein [Bacteroidia bacterium]
MRKPKFEILAGKDGKIYFHLKAANGEIILAGRGFKTKAETIHAIASVMRYGQLDTCIVRRESVSGQHFFQVKSPSGRILGWSEMYISRQNRDLGIQAVKRAVTHGRVFDLN